MAIALCLLTSSPVAFWCLQVLADTTRQALIYNLSKVQVSVAEGIVPWFTLNMPASYFRQVVTTLTAPDPARPVRDDAQALRR